MKSPGSMNTKSITQLLLRRKLGSSLIGSYKAWLALLLYSFILHVLWGHLGFLGGKGIPRLGAWAPESHVACRSICLAEKHLELKETLFQASALPEACDMSLDETLSMSVPATPPKQNLAHAANRRPIVKKLRRVWVPHRICACCFGDV